MSWVSNWLRDLDNRSSQSVQRVIMLLLALSGDFKRLQPVAKSFHTKIPRELNFIKTTLKSSLDSQISLLPLGFSLQMSASKKSGGNKPLQSNNSSSSSGLYYFVYCWRGQRGIDNINNPRSTRSPQNKRNKSGLLDSSWRLLTASWQAARSHSYT